MAPRNSSELAMLYDQEKQKGTPRFGLMWFVSHDFVMRTSARR